eukprot:m.110401 g.110401  ORF g.110401 m.110401 type:complete len:86 (+) comp28035_c0_seq1:642-899(+)
MAVVQHTTTVPNSVAMRRCIGASTTDAWLLSMVRRWKRVRKCADRNNVQPTSPKSDSLSSTYIQSTSPKTDSLNTNMHAIDINGI